jgi:hypothetical protein
MSTTYKPSADDIDWQTRLCAAANEGAVWGVPITNTVFQISRKNQTIRRVSGEMDQETNHRIAAVTAAMGWTFDPNMEEPDND